MVLTGQLEEGMILVRIVATISTLGHESLSNLSRLVGRLMIFLRKR
jgi:hypothetical protein